MQQIDKLISEVRDVSTGMWKDPGTRKERLCVDDRFSYKNFDLKKVFENLVFEEYKMADAKEYFSLDCWKDYCNYLSKSSEIIKPKFLKYSEWNEIGFDD